MFVFLALVFAVGFVAFGVGSDVQGGIADAIRVGGDAGTSVDDAREKVRENPRNAAAKLDLANALLTDGQTAEAIRVLEDYTKQRPKDADALRTLAGVYLTQASRKERTAAIAQAEVNRYSVVQAVLPQLSVGTAAAYFGDTSINQALASDANARFSRAYSEMQVAFDQAKRTYQRLVTAQPNDPDLQLELATAAEQGGDAATAIKAYQRFLKLSPGDPSAPLVRQQIKQLRAQAAAQAPGASIAG